MKECNECHHQIEEQDLYCPKCGTKIEIEDKDSKKITIYQEKNSIITYIIYSIAFLTMLALISSNTIFLKTIRTELSLQQIQFSPSFEGLIASYPSIIINITFISCIISILSKKYLKLSKLLFIINILTSFIVFIYIYINNFRIGNCFYIIVLLNCIYLLLPKISKIIETEITVNEKNQTKYEKKNNKLKELYTKKPLNRKTILFIIIFYVIVFISMMTIHILNSKDIYKETIIQTTGDFQIKVVNEYINVRSDTNTESKILGEVSKGDIFNVLDIIGGENYIWYQIDYKGQVGYIASSREEAYVKELYSDKLVVNIFCTEKEDNCAYLLDFITRYQKTTKKSFLINYLDIKNEYNNDIYNQILTYYQDEPKIPYIIIGDNKIIGYETEDNTLLIEVISEQKNNTINYVDILKKGNQLPELPKEDEEQKKDS